MKQKLIGQLYLRKRNSYYLTTIVGGYLVYLAWQLLDFHPDGTLPTAVRWVAVVVFALFGAAMVLLSVWALVKGYCAENTPSDEDEISGEIADDEE